MNSEQKARALEIIRKDAWVIGLYEEASPKLAREMGCEVGSPVGCALTVLIGGF